MLTEKAYILSGNINRLNFMERGDAYDLKAFSFSKASELHYTYLARKLDLPEPVFFYMYSKLDYIKNLDVLYVHNLGYVISERTIQALLSVKSFEYRKYPISILEEGAIRFQNNPEGYKMPEPYSNPEEFKKKSLRDDMYIFQTLEILSDVFDWEKSIYQQSEISKRANSPGHVREFVLKEPKGGFPPIFRLKESPITVFISAKAREALKLAGIKGYGFLSLQGYTPNSQMQIDVDL
jgi:hypothetical protein